MATALRTVKPVRCSDSAATAFETGGAGGRSRNPIGRGGGACPAHEFLHFPGRKLPREGAPPGGVEGPPTARSAHIRAGRRLSDWLPMSLDFPGLKVRREAWRRGHRRVRPGGGITRRKIASEMPRTGTARRAIPRGNQQFLHVNQVGSIEKNSLTRCSEIGNAGRFSPDAITSTKSRVYRSATLMG